MRRTFVALLIALVGLGALLTLTVAAQASPPAAEPSAASEAVVEVSPAAANGTANILLLPASGTLGVDGMITVTIQIQAGTQQVDGVGAYINFDKDIFTVVDANKSPVEYIDSAAGNPLTTELLNFVDNSAGTIDYAVGKLSGTKPSGTFNIGVFRLLARSLAPAGSQVVFVYDAPNNRVTTITYQGGSVLGTSFDATYTVVQPPTGVTIAGPSSGLVGSSLTFTATTSPITASQPITYLWQATGLAPLTHSGGGISDTATLIWPTSGAKTITVTASNGAGSASNTYGVTIFTPAVADFIGTPTSGVAPFVVTFTNTSSGDWATALWSFGDGGTSASASGTVTHTYAAEGQYTVTLTVSGIGGTDTETKTSYITAYEQSVAGFSGTPVAGTAPLLVSFTNQSSGDWTASSWSFGDGATSTENSPQHTYGTPGIYDVALQVSGPGGTSTITKTDYITVYTPVVANFTGSPVSGQIALSVVFNNSSTGDYSSASWNFGDGSTSSEISPTHVYTKVGTFNVSLTMSGPGGTNTLTRNAYITTTGNTDLVLVPPSGTVASGVPFTVAIQVQSGSQLVDGVGAYLNFDKSVLQVVDAAGDPATVIESAPGNPLTTELENVVDNDAGTINYSVGKLSGSKPSGTFDIGVIRFKPITTTQLTTAVDFAFDAGANRSTDVVYSGGTVLRDAFGGEYTVVNVIFAVTLSLQGRQSAGIYPPNDAYSIPVRMQVIPSGESTPVYSATVNSDLYGVFTVTGMSGVTAGNMYTIRLKNSHTLTSTKNVTVTPGLNNIPFCDLKEGDADDSGQVNITDFSVLAAAFGKSYGQPGWDDRADFNENNQINITDFSLLASNFGQYKENTCAPQAPQGAVHGLNSLVEQPDPLTPAAPAGTVSLVLSPSTKTVGPGDIFTTAITVIAGTQQVDGVEAHLDFTPTVFQVVDESGNAQEFIDNPGTPLTIELMNAVDNGAGKIDFAVGKFSGTKPSGTFVIGTIRFKAVGGLAASGSLVPFVFDAGSNRVTDVQLAGTSVLSGTVNGLFTVVQPPTSVSIGGVATELVGMSLGFTGTVLPVTTTQPITYVWDATDQSTVTHTGGGVTDTVSFNWASPGSKTITVTATNVAGSVTDTHSVIIYTPAVANFTGTPLVGAAPMVVTFTNSSTGDWSTALWSFGDGSTSSSSSTTVAHTFAATGTYTVTLTVSGNGGTNTLTRTSYVTVYHAIDANFSGSPRTGVAPLVVTFTNSTTGDYDSLLWNFGDGSTSTGANPSHTYSSPGTYTVTLTASMSAYGGSNTETKMGYITVYTPAVADFTGTPLAGAAPLMVNFTNSSTGDWSTVLWNFGDGITSTSTMASVKHTYSAKGIYTVTLTVSGNGGTSTLARPSYVTVYEAISVGFSGSPVSGIAPLVVTYTNGTTGDYDSLLWNFGDGSTGTVTNPVHTYAASGIYTVSLAAGMSAYGGSSILTKTNYITAYTPAAADFSGSPTSGIASFVVTFTNLSSGDWSTALWNFGDGSTSASASATVTHTYAVKGVYTVTLTVSGNGGTDAETKTSYITAYAPAAADFFGTPGSGIASFVVTFTNWSTGDWSTALWNFGDGATSASLDATVTHTYSAKGVYTVSLTVSGNGGTDTETKTSYITAYAPAVADFSGTPLSGIASFDVTFSNLSAGDWSTALWSFGDGATSASLDTTVTHTYSAKGIYTVSLTVSGDGGTDTETKISYITVFAPAVAQFSGLPVSGPAPLVVTFTNESTGDWMYGMWSFGDGDTSYLTNPQHTYALPGVYTVSLQVSGLGGSSTITKTNYITVYTPVVADFTGSPVSGQIALSVVFSNLSTGDYSSASWNFGDGSTSVEISPTHVYTRVGTFNVSLAMSGPGGTNTLTRNAYITTTGNTDLVLVPASGTVAAGVPFTVAIQVRSGTQEVDGVSAYLNFSPTVLQVVDAAGNPTTTIEDAAGNPLNVNLENAVDNSAGTIDYSVGKLSGSKPSGTFDIGVIRFKPITTTQLTTAVDFAFDAANNRTTDAMYYGESVLRSTTGGEYDVVNVVLNTTLTLQGRSAPPGTAYSIPVRLRIYDSGNNSVYSDTVNTDVYGTFTVSGISTVTPGNTYSVTVKNRHTLTSTKSVTFVAGTNSVTVCTLYEGDASDDGYVNIADFSILAGTFGKQLGDAGYDSRADFNESNQINIADFSLLAGNFSKYGSNICT